MSWRFEEFTLVTLEGSHFGVGDHQYLQYLLVSLFSEKVHPELG